MKSVLTHAAILAAASVLAGPALAGERVTYPIDGTDYEGYFAPAAEQSKGLVIVIHDWDGLNDYEVRRADMLAELGYDAFAVDLYGKDNQPTSMEENRERTSELYNDRQAMRTRLLAGLQTARDQLGDDAVSTAVVMGYCFGGAATMELARSGEAEDIAGYTSFHGGLTTPDGQSIPDDMPPILIAQGGADTSTPPNEAYDLVGTLEEMGIDYTLEVYSGAPHAFTVFDSDRYQEEADQQSWNSFTNFLERTLAAGS